MTQTEAARPKAQKFAEIDPAVIAVAVGEALKQSGLGEAFAAVAGVALTAQKILANQEAQHVAADLAATEAEHLPAELRAMTRTVHATEDDMIVLQARRSRQAQQMIDEIAMLRDQVARLTATNAAVIAGVGAAQRTLNFQPLLDLAAKAEEQANALEQQREQHYQQRVEADALVRTIADRHAADERHTQEPDQDLFADERPDSQSDEDDEIPAFLRDGPQSRDYAGDLAREMQRGNPHELYTPPPRVPRHPEPSNVTPLRDRASAVTNAIGFTLILPILWLFG